MNSAYVIRECRGVLFENDTSFEPCSQSQTLQTTQLRKTFLMASINKRNEREKITAKQYKVWHWKLKDEYDKFVFHRH
jgi:hypothetical protein